MSAQQGNRAKNYQVGFTEPFLFDRPITAGVDVFNQEIQYNNQFTQASTGMNTVWGFPAGPFSRFFVSYSYQRVKVKDLNPLYHAADAAVGEQPVPDRLAAAQRGRRAPHQQDRPELHVQHDRQPDLPDHRPEALAVDGRGGARRQQQVLLRRRPRASGTKMHTREDVDRPPRGVEFINPYGSTDLNLPIFEKLFLGGEYSIRGFDIRSVGPRDLATGLVIGGNKSLLFNAEYLISIAGPVRLVLFCRRRPGAGLRREVRVEGTDQAAGHRQRADARGPGDVAVRGRRVQQRPADARRHRSARPSAFKTSTGAEIRFFMPVLNVPFRLIFAMNPSRGGVLDNNLQPEKKFKFRFAVGTTF